MRLWVKGTGSGWHEGWKRGRLGSHCSGFDTRSGRRSTAWTSTNARLRVLNNRNDLQVHPAKTPSSNLRPLARLVPCRHTLRCQTNESVKQQKRKKGGKCTFFSFRALSIPRLGLPSTPVVLSELAFLRSNLSPNTLFFFFCALLCNLSGSIAFIFFRSSAGSFASTSANLAWCADSLMLNRGPPRGRGSLGTAPRIPLFAADALGPGPAAAAFLATSRAAEAALARAAATPVLQRSRRGLRLETLRGCPKGRARSSSTHSAS